MNEQIIAYSLPVSMLSFAFGWLITRNKQATTRIKVVTLIVGLGLIGYYLMILVIPWIRKPILESVVAFCSGYLMSYWKNKRFHAKSA